MLLTVFSMLIPLSTPVYAESSEADAWAVIIGVSNYQKVDDVEGSAESAEALFQLLSPVCGREHIKLLLDSEATERNVKAALEWLVSNADATDTVIFYFAGHGAASGAYIAPYDAYYTSTWISASELSRCLRSLESDSVVIILDTCHAGRFETSLGDSGRVILMSSRADEASWVSRSLSDDWYSVFTYYLVEAIRMFDAADANRNYELSAEELFRYAEPKTISRTSLWDSIQHPVMSDQYPDELTVLAKFVFDVNPDLPRNYDILTLDKQKYSYSSLPFELLCAPGSVHDLTAVPQVDTAKGTRYTFASWSDGNRSVSRTISHGGVYRANYKTEHQLVIESAYGEPGGEGWYDAGSTATISVAPSVGTIIRQVFTGWSGDFSGDKPTTQLIMNSPKTITANWRTDYTRLYIVVVGSILGLIVLVLAVRSQRKQENWYLKVLKKYAVFSGRASRREYWMFFLFNTVFLIVASILDLIIFGIGFGPLYILYALAVLIPGLAVLVRRLHDVGKSGWFLFIVLIPIAGPIWILVLTCMDGQPGDNKYGPNPKGEGTV